MKKNQERQAKLLMEHQSLIELAQEASTMEEVMEASGFSSKVLRPLFRHLRASGLDVELPLRSSARAGSLSDAQFLEAYLKAETTADLQESLSITRQGVHDRLSRIETDHPRAVQAAKSHALIGLDGQAILNRNPALRILTDEEPASVLRALDGAPFVGVRIPASNRFKGKGAYLVKQDLLDYLNAHHKADPKAALIAFLRFGEQALNESITGEPVTVSNWVDFKNGRPEVDHAYANDLAAKYKAMQKALGVKGPLSVDQITTFSRSAEGKAIGAPSYPLINMRVSGGLAGLDAAVKAGTMPILRQVSLHDAIQDSRAYIESLCVGKKCYTEIPSVQGQDTWAALSPSRISLAASKKKMSGLSAVQVLAIANASLLEEAESEQ